MLWCAKTQALAGRVRVCVGGSAVHGRVVISLGLVVPLINLTCHLSAVC